MATQRRDGFTIEVVLHPGDLSDLLAPSFPDAACRDHIDLFDGERIMNEVIYGKEAHTLEHYFKRANGITFFELA